MMIIRPLQWTGRADVTARALRSQRGRQLNAAVMALGYSHMLDSLTKTRAPEALVEPSRCLEAQPPANARAARRWLMTLARFLTLVGLLASGVTGLIHQAGNASLKMCRPLTPTDCETVIISQYGSILGVPLPVLGLAGFAMVLGLLLYPKSRGAILLTPLAVVAASAGLVLLAIQLYVIGYPCIVCVAADVAAVGLGGLVLLARLLPRRAVGDLPRATRWGWVGAAIVAVLLAPPVWIIVGTFSLCH